MKTVWKYRIELRSWFEKDASDEVDIPAGAKIVYAEAVSATQWDIWVEVETTNQATPVHFVLYGTGFTFEDDVSHVATARLGDYVWHLYRKNQGEQQ